MTTITNIDDRRRAPHGIGTPRRLKRPRMEIRAELEHYQEEAAVNGWSDKIPCYRRPDDFTEYGQAPHQAEAQELCAKTGQKCPLLAICNEYAWSLKPKGMVLGGVSWTNDGQSSASGRPAYPDERPLNLLREQAEREEAEQKLAA